MVLRTVLEGSDEDFSGTNMTSMGVTVAKMLEIMGGRDSKRGVRQKGSVDLEAFVTFFRELKVDIQRLHFAFYCERGETTISAAKMLASIVAHGADLPWQSYPLPEVDRYFRPRVPFRVCRRYRPGCQSPPVGVSPGSKVSCPRSRPCSALLPWLSGSGGNGPAMRGCR